MADEMNIKEWIIRFLFPFGLLIIVIIIISLLFYFFPCNPMIDDCYNCTYV